MSSLELNNAWSLYYSASEPSASGATPIKGALEGLGAAFGDPNDGEAVILITDGDETCSTQEAAEIQASVLWRRGIRVYAVALTTTANKAFLDRVAAAGGTTAAYQANNAAQLAVALESIMTDLTACQCAAGETGCSADEKTRISCSSGYWAESSCPSSQWCYEAVCYDEREGALRLVGGTTEKQGRLEIYHAGEWGTICNWGGLLDDGGAEIACRQMSFSSGIVDNENTGGGAISQPVWLYEVSCEGTESQLIECDRSDWGDWCGHDYDVWLVCDGEGDPEPEPSDPPNPGDPCGTLTGVGCCGGQTLYFCESGGTAVVDCAASTLSCGWDASKAWYDCGFSGEDPSGIHPKACSF